MISSFIVLPLINVKQIFFGIDSSGFKSTRSSQYYTERDKLRRKWIKLSIGADVLKQIICTIKIRKEGLKTYCIIPPIYLHVLIWRTNGRYRKKQMKGGYNKLLYNQRNKKDETIMSVIKRLFGEYVTSRLVKTQNRESIIQMHSLKHAQANKSCHYCDDFYIAI